MPPKAALSRRRFLEGLVVKKSIFLALGLAAVALASPSAAHARRMGESIYVFSEAGSPSKYFFRGILQNDDGMSLQMGSTIWPFLYESEDIDFALPVQFWMSLHPQQGQSDLEDPPENTNSIWYEAKLGGGWFLRLGQVEFDGRLNMYSSPNGYFDTVTEGVLTIRWNDWKFWNGDDPNQIFRGFQLYYSGVLELDGARDGIIVDGKKGMYGEIGAIPRFHLLESAGLGIDWLIPFAAGSGINYFEYQVNGEVKDHFVGFLRVGSALQFDARFLPRRLGEWGMTVGVDVLSSAQAQADDSNVSDIEMVFNLRSFGRF